MTDHRLPPAELGVLFDTHAAAIARVAARLTGRGAHVDDLVQETFLVALRRPSALREADNVRAWLMGVAANLCRHHHRSHARRGAMEAVVAELPRPEAAGADHFAEQRRLAERLRHLLSQLPYEQAEVFVLKELEQLTAREIATITDAPAKTVESRLRLARARLKDALGGERAARPPLSVASKGRGEES